MGAVSGCEEAEILYAVFRNSMYEQVALTVCPMLMMSGSLAPTDVNVHLTDHCLPDITPSVFCLYRDCLLSCLVLARVDTYST